MKAQLKQIIFLLTIAILTPWSMAYAETCDSAWVWLQEGLALYDNSPREAYYYQQAIDVCPEFVEAYNRLGWVYLNQGEYDLGIQAFQEAKIQALSSDLFSSRPGSSELFIEPIIGLGKIYRMQGKYDLAAAEFKKALAVNPESPAANNNLQYIYKRQHKYDFALSPRKQMLMNAIFTRNPGTTLPEGALALEFQYRNWTHRSPLIPEMFGSDLVWLLEASPDERQGRVELATIGFRYGFNNDFTFGLTQLYSKRGVTIGLGDDEGHQNVNGKPTITGLGDMQVLTKYHVWGFKKNHLSIYNLLTIPLGKEKTAVSNDYIWTFGQFALIERTVPLGAGSVNFTPGIAFTHFYDPFIFHSNIQYRITNGERIGDEFNANFAIIYPLQKSVNVTLETNYRWSGETSREQTLYVKLLRPDFITAEWIPAGPEETNSTVISKGGHSLFISPGLQFTIASDLKLDIGIQLPVIKQALGWREDFVLHIGLTKIFF